MAGGNITTTTFTSLEITRCEIPPPPRGAFLDFDPILPGWPDVETSGVLSNQRAETAAVVPPLGNEDRAPRPN